MVRNLPRALATLLGATLLTASLAGADTHSPSDHDPLEDINRAIFEINGMLYEVTAPLVNLAPDPIRGLFKAVGASLNAPIHLITTIVTNDQQNDDFSDIARQNGVDCGFFLVLPLAGPTNSRDALGEAVEIAANPASQIVVLSAGAAVNERIEAEVKIRELENTVDAYAMARSATMQNRGCVVVDEAEAPSAFGDDAETPRVAIDEEN